MTRRTVGQLARIPLGDDHFAYALVLDFAKFAIYGVDLAEISDLSSLEKIKPIFFVSVSDYAITKNRWPVVALNAFDASKVVPPSTFIQDRLKPQDFCICENGIIRPSTREECAGLEHTAVWDPEHVEDRIRDHYAGRENKWEVSLRVIP